MTSVITVSAAHTKITLTNGVSIMGCADVRLDEYMKETQEGGKTELIVTRSQSSSRGNV